MATINDLFNLSVELHEQREAELLGISVDAYRVHVQAEREQHQALAAQQAAQANEERLKEQALEAAARQALGQSFGLGVPAFIGHIIKASGLSAKSLGDRLSAATVYHIVIDGDLSRGRLKRKAGDLLCRPSSTLGKRSMGISGISGWENRSYASITCAACAKMLNSASSDN